MAPLPVTVALDNHFQISHLMVLLEFLAVAVVVALEIAPLAALEEAVEVAMVAVKG